MTGPEATTDLPPRDLLSSASDAGPRMGVIEGSGPQLATETETLLRSRLRAAAMMLFLAFLLFFVRGLFLPERDQVMAAFHAVVITWLALSIMWLASRKQIPLKTLRVLELTIFGLIVAFFATAQYRLMLLRSTQNNDTLALAAMKSSVLYMFAIMAVYGIFIPNTWRRAAVVVAPMALSPLFVNILLRMVHPEVIALSNRVSSVEQDSDHVLMLLIGAVSSVFGTHIINKLRTEEFEARLLGQYRLGEKLGSGGMGEVFLAEHQLLKRPCAIKLIRPSSAADPKALARFELEVRSTARLSHWNTVEIYDYGRTADGTFYYVMEYLPGLSLAELVERNGPMPPERVVYLLRQACHALSEAHSANLIHRDIKPANIFAAHRGGRHDVTKLLDFGLVKPVSEAVSTQVSQEGTVTGSPLYMSPEQATGSHRPDRRSDIYSLGAVAYFLLTGVPPFRGDNAIAVMIAHARDPVVPPSEICPEIPPDLEGIVLRCLAKNPSDRYQSADELEQALAACACAGVWNQERASEWWQTKSLPAPSKVASLPDETVEYVAKPDAKLP